MAASLAQILKSPFKRLRAERQARLKEAERNAHTALLSPDEGAARIREAIQAGGAFGVGKIGNDELRALNFWQDSWAPPLEALADRRWRKMRVRTMVHKGMPVTTSGIYPINDRMMTAFCEIYADALSEIDLLGVWFNVGEKRAIERFARPQALMRTDALRNHLLDHPWSHAFAGKTVMVVTPFVKTVAQQFARRAEIWSGKPGLLPDFDLVTLRTQQNAGILETLEYRDWLDGFEQLKARLEATPADVVLVGAGAWSLPLVAHAKRLGRFAAHLGGDLQLLFGVTGGRWRDDPVINRLKNNAWTRVLPEEIQNAEKVLKVRDASNYW